MKTLTVAITTFNRWGLCLKAIKSVCRQNIDGVEIILIDDCSSDTMPDNIKKYIDLKGVNIIRHKANKGLAFARNTAIDAASGKYFSFCDDDDQWPEGLAERLVKAIQIGPPEVGLAVAFPHGCSRNAFKTILANFPHLTSIIRKGITPPVSSQIYKTNLVRKIGGYTQSIKTGVDHDLWISLAKIDPRVAVAWGEPAISDNDPTRDRMTTDEKGRRIGIEESLGIWKPKIIDVFGQKFYCHFCYSYQQYLDYSFFVKSYRRGKYLDAAVKSLNPRVINRLVNKIVYKIMLLPQYNIFPEYIVK